MTVEDIMESCADSSFHDWAFWVYLCGDSSAAEQPPQEAATQERGLAGCARAIYLADLAIGLAWSPAEDDEIASLPDAPYHWVELLHDGAVVDRQLAVWVEGEDVSLPVPSEETDGEGDRSTLWVSRRAHSLVRLANEVDPDCSDFDYCFANSGIELR